MNRYQQLAQQLKEQIRSNTWRAGEKIPSIRAASQSFSVSPATVLQAYQLLESEGWLNARPQSGYFVSSILERIEDGDIEVNEDSPQFTDTLFEFLQSNGRATIALGSAFPDPNLFPIATLNRHLASAGRKMSAESVVSNMPPGNEDLRRLIAQRYLKQGVDISHQDIVITSGALEALNLSLQVVTKPGDTVAIESPTFYGALQAIERLGLKPIEIPVEAEQGLNVQVLEEMFKRHDVKAFWLMPNFQNPTGSTLSDEKKQAIVQLASQYNVKLIEDDVYSELYFDSTKPKPLKAWDTKGDVLLCGSLSKSLCPGYRIGWVANKPFNEPIQKQQLISTLSGSVPIQQGVAHFLTHESFDSHLRKLRKELELRQHHLVTLIQSLLGEKIKLHVPNGGYFVWIELPAHIDSHALFKVLVEQGITVAFGGLFGDNKQFSNFIRVNTSFAPSSELDEALTHLSSQLLK
ncbi:PLP-dependent aminotransferase family protein [Vibrio sp. TBV020]|uniref:aminotransferase-like domain-containing protein n=1 Tax=Vibrio sp. TBV020 TaxID=3137398 RepID=UPI0038CD50A1